MSLRWIVKQSCLHWYCRSVHLVQMRQTWLMQTYGRRRTEDEEQSCGSTPQKPDHPPTRCRSQAKAWFRRPCSFRSLERDPSVAAVTTRSMGIESPTRCRNATITGQIGFDDGEGDTRRGQQHPTEARGDVSPSAPAALQSQN
uniref:Uncharacterized protein n=1 Tax=Oryza sativa subsp. japonica TaxID=39947 RepID=Q6K766_ORYSJ|nr:hypothetical protein [Oryza sativa Japonica Group]